MARDSASDLLIVRVKPRLPAEVYRFHQLQPDATYVMSAVMATRLTTSGYADLMNSDDMSVAYVTDIVQERHRVQVVVSYNARGSRAANILDGWATILPARIVNEELGDYIEDIQRRAMAGQRVALYARMMAAIFWTGVNAVGYFVKQVGKTKSA
jgi:hypothetical protein